MRMRGVTTLVAMAAAAALAVSGCSGSAEPDELDGSNNESKSESKDKPTPSPTKTSKQKSGDDGRVEVGPDDEVPTGPEADAAEQFVEQYVKAENKAYRTGDVSKLEDMSTGNCLDCGETIAYISKLYGDGNRLEGYLLDDPTVELLRGKAADGYFVRVTGERGAYQVYDASGDPVPDDKGGAREADTTFVVEQVDGDWQIVGG